MARNKIRLDLEGLEAIARRAETDAALDRVAEEVADNVRSQGITVGAVKGSGEVPIPVEILSDDTTSMRTNRARRTVTLAHPAGIAAQAKHGALTKAASHAGLKVKGS